MIKRVIYMRNVWKIKCMITDKYIVSYWLQLCRLTYSKIVFFIPEISISIPQVWLPWADNFQSTVAPLFLIFWFVTKNKHYINLNSQDKEKNRTVLSSKLTELWTILKCVPANAPVGKGLTVLYDKIGHFWTFFRQE